MRGPCAKLLIGRTPGYDVLPEMSGTVGRSPFGAVVITPVPWTNLVSAVPDDEPPDPESEPQPDSASASASEAAAPRAAAARRRGRGRGHGRRARVRLM